MATVSFGRVMVVDPKYVKNLVYAAEHPHRLDEFKDVSRPFTEATKADMDELMKKYSK